MILHKHLDFGGGSAVCHGNLQQIRSSGLNLLVTRIAAGASAPGVAGRSRPRILSG